MAAVVSGKTITFAAVNDSVAQTIFAASLVFRGTGLTVGQQLTVLDGEGDLILDYFVEAATIYKEFLIKCERFMGIQVSAIPATGGGKLVVRFE